jgi:hypothetical protein
MLLEDLIPEENVVMLDAGAVFPRFRQRTFINAFSWSTPQDVPEIYETGVQRLSVLMNLLEKRELLVTEEVCGELRKVISIMKQKHEFETRHLKKSNLALDYVDQLREFEQELTFRDPRKSGSYRITTPHVDRNSEPYFAISQRLIPVEEVLHREKVERYANMAFRSQKSTDRLLVSTAYVLNRIHHLGVSILEDDMDIAKLSKAAEEGSDWKYVSGQNNALKAVFSPSGYSLELVNPNRMSVNGHVSQSVGNENVRSMFN